jgi:hypothetical protein
VLAEPHRDKAHLVTAVSRTINSTILYFMEPYRKIFEVLQYAEKPTINFAVLCYYKAIALAAPSGADSVAVRSLKKILIQKLDTKFFDSLKAHHWVATFLDPAFRDMNFIPSGTLAERRFKIDLLDDICDVWIIPYMASASERIPDAPTPAKRPSVGAHEDIFADMRGCGSANVNITPNAVDTDISSEIREYKVAKCLNCC